MLCTCIYFAYIGSFDGEDMLATPHDLGVDPDDNQGMPDAENHQEASAQRHAPTSASIPPFARHDRLDTRYKMELGYQLSALIVEAGIRPTHYRDIEADDRRL